MRSIITALLGLVIFSASCESDTDSAGLPETFLNSIKDQKFEALEKFLPTVEFFKTLGSDMPARTDEEIKKFIDESNTRLKESWNKVSETVSSKKINADKIILKETIVYNPFEERKEMKAMVLVYEYEGKTWDDLSFIISESAGKTYLLEIPNPTSAFSFSDELLRESKTAKAFIEMNKPEFKKSVQDQAARIITAIKENNADAFAALIVYRGEDESRKWKSGINLGDPAEKQQAADFMQRVNRNFEGCDNYTAGEITNEEESEGVWIVYPMNCGSKTVYFAFLKVNDKLLLGDVDSEMNN